MEKKIYNNQCPRFFNNLLTSIMSPLNLLYAARVGSPDVGQRNNMIKENQNYCARDDVFTRFSYVSKTYDGKLQ